MHSTPGTRRHRRACRWRPRCKGESTRRTQGTRYADARDSNYDELRGRSPRCSRAERVGVMQRPEALASWGAHDHDNPFPLYAEVRELGAVHPITLADGHAAWLVARYDEARAALNDPRLSKDMQAALAMDGNVLAEGLPGKAFARHMLAVDPPDHTRLRRLVSAAFSVRRVEALEDAVGSIVDDLLDAIEACGAHAVVDLVATLAFPLPFTVICEL